jgi:hypothetical protein
VSAAAFDGANSLPHHQASSIKASLFVFLSIYREQFDHKQGIDVPSHSYHDLPGGTSHLEAESFFYANRFGSVSRPSWCSSASDLQDSKSSNHCIAATLLNSTYHALS